jgi:hypothetical protein
LDPGEIELYKVAPMKATITRKQSVDVQLLRATTLQKSGENYSAAVVSSGLGLMSFLKKMATFSSK